MSVIQTLTASRNATWGPTLIYDYPGPALPLTGAAIAMHLRLYPGQPGEPKLTLTGIDFTDEPLSGTPGTADEWRTLTLLPLVSPNQLATLPGLHTPEAGASQTFAFDIRIDYAGGISEVLSSGNFILAPGVTTP